MDMYDLLLAKKLGGGGGGGVTVEELNVTQNGDYSEEGKAYSPVHVNVSGGGGAGKFELLATHSLGTITTSSGTSSTVGWYDATGVYGYDALYVSVMIDQKPTEAGVYIGSGSFVVMVTNSFQNISGAAICTNKFVWKSDATYGATSTTDTNVYGIYPTSVSITATDNGTASFKVVDRYNSSTGTINAAYTMKVYGIKLYDRPTKTPVL